QSRALGGALEAQRLLAARQACLVLRDEGVSPRAAGELRQRGVDQIVEGVLPCLQVEAPKITVTGNAQPAPDARVAFDHVLRRPAKALLYRRPLAEGHAFDAPDLRWNDGAVELEYWIQVALVAPPYSFRCPVRALRI